MSIVKVTLRRPGRRRTRRSGPPRGALVSVAGLIGRPVVDQNSAPVGSIVDIVCRWDEAAHPAVSGVVVKVGRRRAFLPATQVASLDAHGARLRSARVDLRDFQPREGEVALARHILDHQLVDVDGVRVVRASDLYIGPVGDAMRLVGVEVGLGSLLRRLGPARLRSIVTPARVIDWATVQPLTAPGASVRLGRPNGTLGALRSADLADLLEELTRAQRQELAEALDAEVVAEALEEMEPEPLEELLRDVSPQRAAELLQEMAPDEAAEALRDLEEDERRDVLAVLSKDAAQELNVLLSFEEGTAGSVMTSELVAVTAGDTVAEACRRLAESDADRVALDGVLVVDSDGRLVDDISLFNLLLAERDAPVGSLVRSTPPQTVIASDPLSIVVDQLVANRGTSVVVVDERDEPVGRILADDVIDALLADPALARAYRRRS